MVKFKDTVFATALEVCWLFMASLFFCLSVPLARYDLWLSICSASLSI